MIYLTIAIIAFGTWITRSIPFLVLKKRELSSRTLRLIDSLPYATISLLVVYSLKDFMNTQPLATLIAVVWIIIIHYCFKNSILSIFSSTLLYMLLIHWL